MGEDARVFSGFFTWEFGFKGVDVNGKGGASGEEGQGDCE